MCTAPRLSTVIIAAIGTAVDFRTVSLTRTGAENVRPRSRETLNAMSRRLPGIDLTPGRIQRVVAARHERGLAAVGSARRQLALDDRLTPPGRARGSAGAAAPAAEVGAAAEREYRRRVIQAGFLRHRHAVVRRPIVPAALLALPCVCVAPLSFGGGEAAVIDPDCVRRAAAVDRQRWPAAIANRVGRRQRDRCVEGLAAVARLRHLDRRHRPASVPQHDDFRVGATSATSTTGAQRRSRSGAPATPAAAVLRRDVLLPRPCSPAPARRTSVRHPG